MTERSRNTPLIEELIEIVGELTSDTDRAPKYTVSYADGVVQICRDGFHVGNWSPVNAFDYVGGTRSAGPELADICAREYVRRAPELKL